MVMSQNSYSVVLQDLNAAKNVQILVNRFGEPKNWKTYSQPSYFKISRLFVTKVGARKSCWFKITSFFLERICHMEK